MKKSNSRFLVSSVVILFALFALAYPMAADAETLRIAHEMPENHPYHQGSLRFGEILQEKTDGRIDVTVYPNGQLGKQKQLAEMVAANQLDICLTWQGILEGYDPNTGIICLPFIFESWEHTWKVIDGEIGQEVLKPLEKKGIKVITVFNNGLYNIVSRIPIETPEDMEGVKLRVQPSAVFVETGEMLGAVVTPMAFGEVYSALQLGAVDAEIQGPINVRKSKHYEVADYTCANNMAYLLEPVLMSAKRFNSFSESDQKAIMEAAHEAALWQRKEAEKADVEDTKFLKEQGMNYVYPDRDLWKAAVMPMYDKHPEWKETIERIKAAAPEK
jgi:tripartite ATP-independent transporter DctP family solute receptor